MALLTLRPPQALSSHTQTHQTLHAVPLRTQVRAIKEDDEEVGLQAVEFWSTLCDYELELLEDGEEGEVRGFDDLGV